MTRIFTSSQYLFGFFVIGVLSAMSAVFGHFQSVLEDLLVLRAEVIDPFAD